MAHEQKTTLCFNHDDRIAKFHCHLCLRGVCSDCVMQSDAGIFCSEECRAKAEAASAHISDLKATNAQFEESAKKAQLKSSITQFLVLILLLAAVYLVWENVLTPEFKTKFLTPLIPIFPFLSGLLP